MIGDQSQHFDQQVEIGKVRLDIIVARHDGLRIEGLQLAQHLHPALRIAAEIKRRRVDDDASSRENPLFGKLKEHIVFRISGRDMPKLNNAPAEGDIKPVRHCSGWLRNDEIRRLIAR